MSYHIVQNDIFLRQTFHVGYAKQIPSGSPYKTLLGKFIRTTRFLKCVFKYLNKITKKCLPLI